MAEEQKLTLKKSDVFISYGRKESKAFAKRLHDHLVGKGFDVWFDQNDIPLGIDFQEQIDEGISKASNFIFLIAPHAVLSPYCRKEIELAVSLNKRIIPMLHVEPGKKEEWDAMHPTIGKLNWVYARQKHSPGEPLEQWPDLDSIDGAFAQLVDLLEHQQAYVRTHRDLLVDALAWDRAGRPDSRLVNKAVAPAAEEWLDFRFEKELPPCLPNALHHEYIWASKVSRYKAKLALPTQAKDAYLSFAGADAHDAAWQLAIGLLDEGFSVWLDDKDDPDGTGALMSLEAITTAHNVIVLPSPAWAAARRHTQELAWAYTKRKRTFALRPAPFEARLEPPSRAWLEKNFSPAEKEDNWNENLLEFMNWLEDELRGAAQNPHEAIFDKASLPRPDWFAWPEAKAARQRELANLAQALRADRDYVETHTRLLVAAAEWERNQKATRLLLVGQEQKLALEWLRKRYIALPPCPPTPAQCEYICASRKNAENRFSDVFVAYHESDAKAKRKLVRALHRHGITTWQHDVDIAKGEDFQKAILAGIEEADNLLVINSPSFHSSDFCQMELRHALRLNKRVVPLLTGPQVPEQSGPELKRLQHFHFEQKFNSQKELDIDELLALLATDREYHQTHKMLLHQALRWERQKHNNSLLLRGYTLDKAHTWLELGKGMSHPPTPEHRRLIEQSQLLVGQLGTEVFISYSRTDGDFARRLNMALQDHGKYTWFDQESIASGADFQKEIYNGIRTADNFVFLISPESVRSPYCADEVEYALKYNKRLITLLWRPTSLAEIHPALAAVQWIDFLANPFQQSFNELVRALDTDREHVRQHSQWAERANEWLNSSKDNSFLLRGSELVLAQEWLAVALQGRKKPEPLELHQDFVHSSEAERKRIHEEDERQKSRMLELEREKAAEAQSRLALQEKVARRRRTFSIFMAVAMVAALILGGMALRERNKARQLMEDARQKARISNANLLANEARYLLDKDNTLAIRAIEHAYGLLETPTPIISRALVEILVASYKRPVYQRKMEHESDVMDWAYAEQGQRLFTLADNRLWVWNGQGNLLLTSSAWADRLACSGDGQRLLLLNTFDRHVTLTDGQANALRRIISADLFDDMAFVGNQGHFVLTTRQKISLHDRAGETVMEFSAQTKLQDWDFDPGSGLLWALDQDNSIRVWNLRGQELHRLNHREDLKSCLLLPQGAGLLLLGDKGLLTWAPWETPIRRLGNTPGDPIALHRLAGGRLAAVGSQGVLVLDSLGKNLARVAASGQARSSQTTPDGSLLFVFEAEQKVLVIDAKTLIGKTLELPTGALARTLSPEGVLASSHEGFTEFRDTSGAVLLRVPLGGALEPIFGFGKYLTAQGRDIFLWDPAKQLRDPLDALSQTGALPAPQLESFYRIDQGALVFYDNQGQVRSTHTDRRWSNLNLTSDSKHFYQIDDQGLIVLDLNGQIRFSNPRENLLSLEATPDGKHFFAQDPEGVVYCLDAKGQELWQQAVPILPGEPPRLAYDGRRGKLLAFGSFGLAEIGQGRAQMLIEENVWDVQFGKARKWIAILENERVAFMEDEELEAIAEIPAATHLRIMPDGEFLLAFGLGPSIQIWEFRGDLEKDLRQHSKPVQEIVMAHQRELFLSVSSDNSLKIWNFKFELVANLPGHERRIVSAIFSPDDQMVITSSSDQLVKFWNLRGELLAEIEVEVESPSLFMNQSGDQVLALADDGSRFEVLPTPQRALAMLQELEMAQMSIRDRLSLGIDISLDDAKAAGNESEQVLALKHFVQMASLYESQGWRVNYRDTASLLLAHILASRPVLDELPSLMATAQELEEELPLERFGNSNDPVRLLENARFLYEQSRLESGDRREELLGQARSNCLTIISLPNAPSYFVEEVRFLAPRVGIEFGLAQVLNLPERHLLHFFETGSQSLFETSETVGAQEWSARFEELLVMARKLASLSPQHEELECQLRLANYRALMSQGRNPEALASLEQSPASCQDAAFRQTLLLAKAEACQAELFRRALLAELASTRDSAQALEGLAVAIEAERLELWAQEDCLKKAKAQVDSLLGRVVLRQALRAQMEQQENNNRSTDR